MPGQAYDELLSEADVAMLPWLYRFLVCYSPLSDAASEDHVISDLSPWPTMQWTAFHCLCYVQHTA